MRSGGGLLLILAIVLGFVLFPGPGAAAGAMEQLRTAVARVVDVLQHPAGERRMALSQIMSETFDFEEMARRALGGHWVVRTPAEREMFVSLMAGLLERAYLSKVDLYSDSQITYVGAHQTRDEAIVQTRIVPRHAAELPVDYRMHRRGEEDDWLIYDVVIDGVSVVDNYRAQFDEIIGTSSYSELVSRMQALVDHRR